MTTIKASYRLSSIQRRLKQIGITDFSENRHVNLRGFQFHICSAEGKSNSLFVHEFELVSGEPAFLKGLKMVKCEIRVALSLEQNRHLKVGTDKYGSSHYEVDLYDESYEMPTSATGYSKPQGWRSLVRIHVVGENLQSVFECYKFIRSGERIPKVNYGSEMMLPSHCTTDVRSH